MAASAGRKLRISIDGTPVAGCRVDGFTINNEPIDITDKDSNGFRTLMADVATRSVDASIEGLLTDDTLIIQATGIGSVLLSECTITFEDTATMVGDFFLNSVEIGANHDDAVTFSGSLQSSGEFIYTPAV